MTSLFDEFARVCVRRPCPVCAKPNWCLVSRDGGQDPSCAICKRVESASPWGQAGWFHRLRDGARARSAWRCRTIKDGTIASLRFTAIAARIVASSDEKEVATAAAALGLSVGSLRRLGCGSFGPRSSRRDGGDATRATLALPMRSADGAVIGIRLRLGDGRRLAVRGSRNGLFFAHPLPERVEELIVAEGETDTAALLDLGFHAVGRPGCSNGSALVHDLVRRLRVRRVVVLADNDAPGLEGAAALGRELRIYCPVVRVIAPPAGVKDMRAWKRLGASANEVREAIELAEPLGLHLSIREGGRS